MQEGGRSKWSFLFILYPSSSSCPPGDDVGMHHIASKLKNIAGYDIPNDAFSYARDSTPHAGLGGHTLAAVYARHLSKNKGKDLTNLDELQIDTDPETDWNLCPKQAFS